MNPSAAVVAQIFPVYFSRLDGGHGSRRLLFNCSQRLAARLSCLSNLLSNFQPQEFAIPLLLHGYFIILCPDHPTKATNNPRPAPGHSKMTSYSCRKSSSRKIDLPSYTWSLVIIQTCLLLDGGKFQQAGTFSLRTSARRGPAFSTSTSCLLWSWLVLRQRPQCTFTDLLKIQLGSAG